MLVATRYATEIRSSSNDEAHANLLILYIIYNFNERRLLL